MSESKQLYDTVRTYSVISILVLARCGVPEKLRLITKFSNSQCHVYVFPSTVRACKYVQVQYNYSESVPYLFDDSSIILGDDGD
jgi:hypothetical protein